VGGRLRIENGEVRVPDGPGHGVTLDRVRLAEAHRRYQEAGLVRRDDEAEMRKRQPDWRFMATRY
jgi:glucarate dehydratase